MPKTYVEPQPYSTEPYQPITLLPVESSQIAAVGYSPERKTLAVTFIRSPQSIYHYQDVEPEVYAGFVGAESIGRYFGMHIKSLRFKKFPAPVAANAA
ncbi:KTSC domain-containing protein [Variovorax paradoxus]|nr:KTSC domain-containing protein [Variovorax paradoxus]MBT2299220.1 KTSC domain-containing protein [Variovorax paradoxus]